MKKIWLVIIMIWSWFPLGAQIAEIGGGIGTFSYTGDLQRGYNFLLNRPAVALHFRSNINNYVSFKVGLTGGNLIGNDRNPIDVFAAERNSSFNIVLIEAAGVIEYHFLDFKEKNTLYRWSPYFYAGAGLFTFFGEGERTAEYSNVQPVVPVGFGVKYIYNPKWILGIQFGARHTFFDYLDNISDGIRTRKNYQYGNVFDNDMYYFIGVTINYSFFKIPCPYPYHKTYRE